MNRAITINAWILVVLVMTTTNSDVAAQPRNELEGDWTCASAVVDGRPLNEETVKLLRLTLKDGRYKTTRGDEVLFDSTYTIDAKKSPKQIDMIGTEGELKGKPALGIYKLDGDTLTNCYCLPGGPRPAAFESPPQSGVYLIVWKRT